MIYFTPVNETLFCEERILTWKQPSTLEANFGNSRCPACNDGPDGRAAPRALAVDLNVDVGFYFKQSRGGTCTLASAAMMLRRRAYLDGMDSWWM